MAQALPPLMLDRKSKWFSFTKLPNYSFTKSLDLACFSHISFLPSGNGKRGENPPLPATVCAENLSNMPLGGSHSRLMLA